VIAAVFASFPAPPGSQIEIGPLNLRAYGLMIGLGVVAAVYVMGRMFEAKQVGTSDDASTLSMWAVAAGIVGARLYHVATDWERFDDDLGAIPQIWKGGLGIPGALVTGIGAGLYVARRRGLDMARVATCAAPAIPLGQAIGRWGNWFNQELFGRPTDLPWALEVDAEKIPLEYSVGTTFHPTFLYESLWNVALFGVLLLVDRRLRLGPGRLLAVYVMGYGLGRLWVEGLRIDPADELGGLRWNQWVALAGIVGGAAYLVFTRGRRWPEPAPADATPDLQDQPG
jgi:prolipoprotein diacylglyceryl transferase